MLARVEPEGEERLQAQLDGIAARNFKKGFKKGFTEGREEIRAEGRRDLLRHMAKRRFGAEAAQQLDPLLAATEDPECLSEIGTWITDCVTG